MARSQKISTCLWFNGNAVEATEFYVSLFDDSRVTSTSHYGKNAPMPEGTVLTVTFELAGVEYMALNGNVDFPFTQAASIVVYCDTQQEIDRLWSALTADGGKEIQCGWLTDRFGLSWQIVPDMMRDILADADAARRDRVMGELMQMVKLDIAALTQAAKG